MKTTKRLALAVAAAGVALTACSSPMQAGAAAIVGDERITTGELDERVRAAERAMERNPGEQQLQLHLPQAVLLQMVEVTRYEQLAERAGVTVSDTEIDTFITVEGGGAPQVERTLLANGVAPAYSREYIRAYLTARKLLAKHGGGTDQAALQRGQEVLTREIQTISVTYSPRYGTYDPQQGFLESDRFTSLPEQPAAG